VAPITDGIQFMVSGCVTARWLNPLQRKNSLFQIESVELENFRSYRGKHTFNLPTEPGLYLLTGRNEVEPRLGTNDCGKSTLLDAIFWCLYGRTSRGLKAADVVNWDEKHCAVQVTMYLANHQVQVRRTQNPNSLTRNGIPHTQENIHSTLGGVGPDAFLYSMMLPQFGESFFDLSPAAKLTLFSQIMGLDYWLEKSQEAAETANEIWAEVEEANLEENRCEAQIETMTADLAYLATRQRAYTDTQKKVIATLKADLAADTVVVKKNAEGIKFAEDAIKNIDNKLSKIQKGKKVCLSCQQIIPNSKAKADEEALEKNRRDFERQLIQLRSHQAVDNGKLKYIELSIRTEGERLNPYGEQIRQKQASLASCKKQQADLISQIETAEKDHAAVNFWVGGFKRVRLFLVEETLRQLELEVNNNLSNLGLTDWRIEFDVERENKSGGITKGFVVFVYAPGRDEPVRFEAWSGGATQRLRMAGDLGLANLIMVRAGLTSTVEFYDEPSRHLSEEGQLDLAETLMQRALADKKVIFLVDHNLIDFGFTGTITVVKTASGSQLSCE
jgi:DNA repair exonuclease SbcCD ATPase subunit